ncbi:MAG: hypothetical protein WAU88_07885 [Candidatus Zixiibacteriota bacterium]
MKLSLLMQGMGRSILLSGLIVVCCFVTNGCGGKQEEKTSAPKESAPMRDINAVMADHTPELMPIPGVTGVAIGQLDDGTPCILVLVENDSSAIVSKIPKTLEGYPTKIEVTGKIVPMDGK